MPHSSREESKRLLTYLIENEYAQNDDWKNEVLIHGKSYNLIDFTSDLIENHKRLKSFDSNLYKFFSSSNFPKSLIEII